MCQFKSAMLLKDRVFVPDYDSHDRMLEELGITDDFAHASKVFVRVELSPTDGDVTSDPMGWKIRIDQDILPDWFVHEVDEQRVKVAIAEWCKEHVFRDGHHVVHDGGWIAAGNSTVDARGSSTVVARGSSKVDAWDNSTVVLTKVWQTNQPVKLHDEAICINHKTHTIRSAIKWQQEENT